ncbi:hypothetical protein [Synechococcus sp. CC9616]|uniref:hypothetical protein n=1 Tax=Synechococcus sp. CC9616 TaxID=110663 RepID=UPI00048ACB79|nr:hypothetical protein [Synechococcus sp. CC9616]
MHWAPTLLRKFSSTGHFRLLNQLRSDLRKRPLDRDAASGMLKMPGSGRFSRQPAVRSTPVVSDSNLPKSPQYEESAASQQQSHRTFRDRLNAIDMR